MMSLALWTGLDAWGFAVLRVLLSLLWQSSILLVAVAGLSWLLRNRRASARHAVWLGAVLLTPTLPLLAAWVESAGAPQAPVSVMPVYVAPVAENEEIGPISRIGPIGPMEDGQREGPSEEAAQDKAEGTSVESEVLSAASVAAPPPVDLLDYPWALALLAYCVCLAGSLSWFGLGHVRVLLWRSGAMPCIDGRVRDAFHRAGERLGLGGPIRILESARISAPVTIGVLRSVVLLPKGLAATLDDAELDAVALHESAHAKRRDALVLSLAALIRAILFFHPLVWLAAHQLRVLAEHAADDAVLDAAVEPISYAKLLTRIAERLPRRTPAPEYAAGIVLSRSAFIHRVEAVLSDRRDQIRRLTRWALAGTVTVGLVSLGVSLALPLAQSKSFYVSGDADGVELVGVRPNVGNDMFDGDGEPIASPSSFTTSDYSYWDEDEWRRDFVFRFPASLGEIHVLGGPMITQGDRAVDGSLIGQHVFRSDEGDAYVVLPRRLPREHCDHRGTRRDVVDINVRYFAGEHGDPDHVFTGPFEKGQVVESGGKYDATLETLASQGTGGSVRAAFRVTIEKSVEVPAPGPTTCPPLIAYDVGGGWHLGHFSSGSFYADKATKDYRFEGLPLESIARLTLNEKYRTAFFHNVRVSWPDVPERTYAPFYDEVAARLGMSLSSEEDVQSITRYDFRHHPDDALAVLDVTGCAALHRPLVQSLWFSRPRLRPDMLTPEQTEQVRATALRWLGSWDPGIQRAGVDVGLWIEPSAFVDSALRLIAREEQNHASLAGHLAYSSKRLNGDNVEAITEFLLSHDIPRSGRILAEAISSAEDEPESFRHIRRLAESDKPWLWASVIRSERLFRLMCESEPPSKELATRMVALGVDACLDDEQKAAVVDDVGALLSRLLTAEFYALTWHGTVLRVLEQMDEQLEPAAATESVVRFLKDLLEHSDVYWDRSDAGDRWFVVRYAVAFLNRWNDVNIGGIGKESHLDARSLDLRVMAVEAVQWHESGKDPGMLSTARTQDDRAVRLVWRCESNPELSVIAVWTEEQGDNSGTWTPLSLTKDFLNFRIATVEGSESRFNLEWKAGVRGGWRGGTQRFALAGLPKRVAIDANSWRGEWSVWLERADAVDGVLEGTKLFSEWRRRYLESGDGGGARPKVFFDHLREAMKQYVLDSRDFEGWSPMEIALREALDQDYSFNGEDLRPFEEDLSQQGGIAAWKAFLERDDLTPELRAFAWWRVGALNRFNMRPPEEPNNDAAREAFANALAAAPEYVATPTLNSANNLAAIRGEPAEWAERIGDSYEWMASRTVAMLESSVRVPAPSHAGGSAGPLRTAGSLQGGPGNAVENLRKDLQSELSNLDFSMLYWLDVIGRGDPAAAGRLAERVAAARAGATLHGGGVSGPGKGSAPERGRVSGTVINETTGTPTEGAFVAIDHSGDAGGTNLDRFREDGLYVTAKTDREGRFVLENVAFGDRHPLYVTCPGYVRYEYVFSLPKQYPDLKLGIRLAPAAAIEGVVVDADGEPFGGAVLVRLESLDGHVLLPPGEDWPRFHHRTQTVKPGETFSFGELEPGVYGVAAFAISGPEAVPDYVGRVDEVEVFPGQRKKVELRREEHENVLTVRLEADPHQLPEHRTLLLVSQQPGVLLWANSYFYHPEDERLGRLMDTAFIMSPLVGEGLPAIDNLPPGEYSLLAVSVGKYGGFKSPGVCVRGVKAGVVRGAETVVDIPWAEPSGPGHVKALAFDRLVEIDEETPSVNALCEALAAATEERVHFAAAPSIEDQTVDADSSSVWRVLESLHASRGWTVKEGEGQTLILDAATGAQKTAPAANTRDEGLAWQRTDEYVAPDAAYFPDDEEGGKRLDALFDAADRDRRPAEEVLATVRRGLRRTRYDKGNVLRWVGNAFIWGENPQHPEAIEIMYHAIPLSEGTAIYFGLSVVKTKSPNILKTLADIGIRNDDPNDLHRIAWGCASQKEELLEYVRPYLESGDDPVREKAEAFARMIRGDLKAFAWAAERGKARAEQDFAEQLPELKEKLRNGDSAARGEVLHLMSSQHHIMSILDDSFLNAFAACAEDADANVRSEVARKVGGRWVWNAQEQHPDAIALMLELSRDVDRETRNRALYFGLSTVKDKQEPVIRRLVEMALVDHDHNQYDRVTWGLKHFGTDAKRVARVMDEFLEGPFLNAHEAASVYFLYGDLFDKAPENADVFEEAVARYPEDVYAFSFDTAESFKPESQDDFWEAFDAIVPDGMEVPHVKLRTTTSGFLAVGVIVYGARERDALQAALEASPNFRFGKVAPLSPQRQLHLEEMGMSPMPERAAGKTEEPSGMPGSPGDELTLELDSSTMQDAVSRLCTKYGAPVAFEWVAYERDKDVLTLGEAIAEFEELQRERSLTPREQQRLTHARGLRDKGKPLDLAFDSGERRFTRVLLAATFEGLLDQVTADGLWGTYTWEKNGGVYVILPRGESILGFSVSLDVENRLLEEVVQDILDQQPPGTDLAQGQVMTGFQRGLPWARARVGRLTLTNVPAREALCRAMRAAGPTFTWEIAGYRGGRTLSIQHVPQARHVFTGIVSDKEGRPIEGAQVRWSRIRNSPEVAEGTTDADGRYRLEARHAGGDYVLTAAARGYAPAWKGLLTLAPGGQETEFDFELKPGHRLEGVVVDKGTWEPLVNVAVKACVPWEMTFSSFRYNPYEGMELPGGDNTCWTDAKGCFRFESLPAGEVGLRIDSETYSAGIRNYSVGDTVKLELTPKDRKQDNVIRGRVVDDTSGEPITKFTITANVSEKGFNSPDGRFVFEDLPRYQYRRIWADAEGYATGILRDVLAAQPGEAEEVEFRLKPGKRLEGIVTDVVSGKPVEGARLLYSYEPKHFEWAEWQRYDRHYSDISALQRTTTGADGRFHFAEFVDEPGTLFVQRDGYARRCVQPGERLRDEETGLVNIGLASESVVFGIHTLDGKPVPDARIEIREADRSETMESLGSIPRFEPAMTDDRGRYWFAGLPEGRYHVWVAAGDGMWFTGGTQRTIELGPGETPEVNLGEPAGGLTLKGRVLVEGAPKAWCVVTLTPQFECPYDTYVVVSDARGRYSFTGLPPGAYDARLTLRSSPYSSLQDTKETRRIELAGDLEVDL